MTFANPAAFLLLGLTIPILLLHVLRPRRERIEVPSTFLWDEAPSPVSAAVPWQRLRPSWLLLAQLLAVLLLATALAQPTRATDAILADHTVFVIDTSASMAARDGSPDRLADALGTARDLRGQMRDGSLASVVVAGPRSRVLLSASPDRTAFDDALDRIEVSGAPADFVDAFLLAESLETPGVPIGFALISDGGLSIAEQRLLPPDTTYHGVGRSSTNRAVSSLVVEPTVSGLGIIATVTNHGADRVEQPVRVDVDGLTAAETVLDIGPGDEAVWEIDTVPGDRVDVFLESEDLIDADDHGYAVTARRRELTALIVGPRDPFLDRALAVIPSVTVEHVESLPLSGTDADVVVFNQVNPPDDPGAPFLAIAPPDGAGPITVLGEVTAPSITLVDPDHAITEDLDLVDVVVSAAQQVDPGPGQVLVAAPGAPLLIESTTGNRPFLYLAFDTASTNLPLQVAFPVLMDRAVTLLAGSALPPTGVEVGDSIPITAPDGATVITPGKQEIAVPPGTRPPRADRTGFWRVLDTDGNETVIAVNAPAAESKVDPVPGLPTELSVVRDGEERPRGERSVVYWFLWPLLAVVVAEALLARRRLGVGRRQWRFAAALRVGVAALVVAALFGVTINRPAGEVATVFLIDASDSLSTGGRSESIEWVQDALDAQPGGVRSAVALFGKDARLESTLQQDNSLGVPAVQIDAAATDPERALRLAGAVLPTDARRRIVMLSDGRFTTGDGELEASILGNAGIQIDVVPVGRQSGVDVAIVSVDAPGAVQEGETYSITATLDATDAATVVVGLLADGDLVEERIVEVEPGATTVTFEREAEEDGVDRYQIQVAAPGDEIVQNDSAFSAVRVEGPARVLIIEGQAGDSRTLRTALEAGELLVDTVSPASIPALEELATYRAVVLVDVEERALTDEHIEQLGIISRDLGRGLLVIGGERSYGLGGYLDSELEELLPVVSEILDPERRQTVAEVLAIDTSGSMGNCHCSEGGNASDRPDGGSNKTDISRSGAARAIDALSENDEVGVLAFNSFDQWVIDLQKLPSEEVVTAGLNRLFPSGGTNVTTSLMTAANALRESQASLKHIIFFSDGFTEVSALADLATEAGQLAAEGITVSVVATGEGAADELEAIATQGQGRFYPGRDLQQIPEILMEEAVIASRDFVTEGQFFPEITTASEVVENLTSSPALLGYVGTTEKPTARTLLRIGPDRDPLLTTWQTGIGTVSAWSSDSGERWGQLWAEWDGYVDFWNRVVRDTFPAGVGAGSVTATVGQESMSILVEGAETFPEGAEAIARVTQPDGTTVEIPLQRTAGARFEAEITLDQVGTFAVGAAVEAAGEGVLSVSTITNSTFAPEYLPGAPEPEALLRLSELSGGRGAIGPTQAFDVADLAVGTREIDLANWFLLAAILLWPIAIALSRLAVRAPAMSISLPTLPSRPDRPAREPAEPRDEQPAAEPETTVGELLRRKRGEGSGQDPPA